MKNMLLIFAGLMLMFSTSYSQTGKVFDDLSIPSKILGGERKYAVYLPPCYENSQRSYPVLYLLHGAGDDQSGWIQFGEVLYITDKAIREGNATPMIIIMPDANTGQRGYFNDISGKWRYEDFFFDELIPFVEKEYRIRSEKRFRAIAGLSMGGGGTFMYALRRPELFSSACPLSAYIGPLSFEEAKARIRFAGDISDIPDNVLKEYYENHNALSLINNWPEANKNQVRWYIDCGDDDFLYEGNSLVHIAMKKNNIPHQFRIRGGGHTWTYWRESLPKVLEFISEAFHQY
jgi:enterochelin esterase-like enzyme